MEAGPVDDGDTLKEKNNLITINYSKLDATAEKRYKKFLENHS